MKSLFRDTYAPGDRFEKHLFGMYEGFISDIEGIIEDAQRRGLIIDVPARWWRIRWPPWMGQLTHRRLVTDDGLGAEVTADFVVSLVLDGLLPR